ncbi:MurR/RpiR family transcriptional regulator [Oscillospiraceae bacterium LTW-04]|nr:MurR/RpiR family transcriptional regulator [Oscillospiraceae bacterium MB24-C1]
MHKDLISLITNMMPKLSKGQKQIARYIVEHYDKAAFMTAARLGQAVGVSESTVVRFASELGYDGYPQLQRSLQELIRNRLTTVQRMELTGTQLGEADILNRVLTMDIDKIRRTLEEVSREEFAATVDALLTAHTIYILGIRSSASLASFLAFYFNHVFDNVRLVTSASTSDVFEQLLNLGKGDVFIGISFPRYSKRTLAAMKFAQEREATTISITDSSLSPIAELADLHLYARSEMASFVDSLVAPLSLLNALIIAVGIKRREETSRAYSELERIWERYEVYTKADDNDR